MKETRKCKFVIGKVCILSTTRCEGEEEDKCACPLWKKEKW